MRNASLLAWLLFLVCIVPVSHARQKTNLPEFDWNLKVGVAGIYNNNILRLSGPDQNAFRRYDSGFRTPLETVDDFETEFTLAPTIQWRSPGNLLVTGAYRFKGVSRAKNDNTNYQTHSLTSSVRPRVRGYWWTAKASILAIPSFYLRVYRDRDLGIYEDARFASREYNGEFAIRTIESLWIAAQGGFGSNYYGEKFTEFDSEFTEIGAEMRYALRGKQTVSLRYTRRISINIGKDQAFLTTPLPNSDQAIEDNEYGDADNNENEVRFTIRSPLRLINSVALDGSVSSRFRRKVFVTERSIIADPFHSGRLDNRWDITPALTWGVSSIFDIEASFTYEQRESESDIAGVSQVKNFVRREFGIGMTYKIN